MGKPALCRECGRGEAEVRFYSGLRSLCSDCHKTRVRENRRKNVEYYRLYDQLRQQVDPKRRARVSEIGREWRLKYPEKYRAQTALNNAVRDGRVIKPSSCESCGSEDHLHGHHHDYAKPLNVKWLCPACHRAHHLAEANP